MARESCLSTRQSAVPLTKLTPAQAGLIGVTRQRVAPIALVGEAGERYEFARDLNISRSPP